MRCANHRSKLTETTFIVCFDSAYLIGCLYRAALLCRAGVFWCRIGMGLALEVSTVEVLPLSARPAQPAKYNEEVIVFLLSSYAPKKTKQSEQWHLATQPWRLTKAGKHLEAKLHELLELAPDPWCDTLVCYSNDSKQGKINLLACLRETTFRSVPCVPVQGRWLQTIAATNLLWGWQLWGLCCEKLFKKLSGGNTCNQIKDRLQLRGADNDGRDKLVRNSKPTGL